MNIAPPAAAKIPHRIEQLGRVREDEYAWMKDPGWQRVLRDPSLLRADIRAHLEAENRYSAAVLAPTEALQATILAELRGRLKEDDSTVPVPDGPWAYYQRYAAGAQHPVYARRPRGAETGEQVLLDADAMARGHAYFRVTAVRHSADHLLLGWAEDAQGSEVYRVLLRDIATGDAVGAPVESCTGSFALSPCGRFLFWVYRDDRGRPRRVLRRQVGGTAADDVLVHEEADEGFFVDVGLTASRAFIVIACGNKETSEAWVVPAERPEAPPVVVARREAGLRYDLEHWDGSFILRTNADGALDFKLVRAPVHAPARAQWTEFVAHRPGHYIVAMAAFAGHLVRVERVDANNRLIVTQLGSLAETEVTVAEEAYLLGLAPRGEWDTAVLPYTYASPTQPAQQFDLDMRTGARVLRKTQEIPSGHDPSRYVTRRLHAPAADGAMVPVTVLMRRDTPRDGSAPVLLYGYGAYGMALQPGFSILPFSLVDRGWVWATAHVRGGSERGFGWFLDGRGMRKPNTFSDFIACAEHLIAQGFARAGRIVAHGASAGGMLMGAVLNLRPDLWAGVAAGVPFVDVLNTMSDDSLPLTPPEWPEWGNPLTDAAAYDVIASYSPYDNVTAQDYPAVLALGGLSDPRVTYWEPAKWVARLRAHTTGERPVLLRINMAAGHGGAAGRFEHLRDPALVYAFAIGVWQLAQAGH
jgi:oligopeptidase B